MNIAVKDVIITELGNNNIDYTADLLIDGRNVAYVIHSAKGTEIKVHLSEYASIVDKAGIYLKGWYLINRYDVAQADTGDLLKMHIDHLVNFEYRERFAKRMERAMEDRVLFGIPGSYYKGFFLKKKVVDYGKSMKGIVEISAIINIHVLPKLETGAKIFNHNLPPAVLIHYADFHLEDALNHFRIRPITDLLRVMPK